VQTLVKLPLRALLAALSEALAEIAEADRG
jgi:hypothetical protein